MKYTIREMRPEEAPLLRDFTYEAIFQREGDPLIPRDSLEHPSIKVYYENFGKPGDFALFAEQDGKPVGAVWARILTGETKGFGNIDPFTPEFAISLYKEYRGNGVGTALMQAMLRLLKEKGYRKTSLAVQKDNYAVKMYQKVGFRIMKEQGPEYLMLCELGQA